MPEWQAIRFIFASYRSNGLRVLLVLIALLTATAGLSAVLLINQTAKESYQTAGSGLVSQVYYQIVNHRQKRQGITKAQYAELRQQGFNQLIPLLRQRVMLDLPGKTEARAVNITGVDSFALLSLPQVSKDDWISKNQPQIDVAALWRPPYAAFIHPQFASNLGLEGDQELVTVEGVKLPPLKLTAAPYLGREIVMDIAQLQQRSGLSHITELLVVGKMTKDDLALLRQALPPGLKLEPLLVGEQASQLTDSFHLNLLAMALLMFVVCLFIVMNTLNLLFTSRMANIKILRQLGIGRLQLFGLFVLEVCLFSILASLPGSALGVKFAALLSAPVQQTLENLYGVSISFGKVSLAWLYLISLIACLLGGLIAAMFPLKQLNQQLSRTAQPAASQSLGLWLASACSLFLLFCAVVALSSSLVMSFIAIALLIFSGCALLIYLYPLVLAWLSRLISPQSPIMHWSIANSIMLSRRSKVACCAFFIAVASNVGMNLMVDSFRLATQNWLQQRMVADHYLYTEQPQALMDWYAQSKQTVALFPRIGTTAQITDKSGSYKTGSYNSPPNKSIELYSHPETETYRQAVKIEDRAYWQRFIAGEGILINQQLAMRFNLAVGEELTLSIKEQRLSFQILAIYQDYGNPQSQALLPLANPVFTISSASAFALHSRSPAQLQGFYDALDASEISYRQYSAEQLQSLSMQAFDQTFVITDSLNIVTLLVAALSLATSVLLLSNDNSAQRGLMRSFGINRQQLRLASLCQYMLLCLVAAIAALPFGMLMSWLLINLINKQAFQWTYPLQIDLSSMLAVVMVSLLMVFAVIFIPVLKTNSKPLIEDIKCLG